MYVFVCDSSADYTPEVRVYRKLENAKNAVKKRFEEYVNTGNYNLASDKEKLKQEFKEDKSMGFTVELEPFEIIDCHIEEQDFYEDLP